MSPPARTPGLVSVVIPAFNAERGLARCIDSVLAQRHSAREVIVVDDGSTDGTAGIAAGYGDRVTVVRQENRGECAARNTGFALGRGEFIAFVDHDDYWDPRFLEECVGFLAAHPGAVAVSAGSDHRSALNDELTLMPAFLADVGPGEQPRTLPNFFDFWADHNHVCAGAVVVRGSCYDEAGGQREDLVLSGDLEYWAYLATFGSWGFVPRVLLHVDGTQVGGGDELYEKYRKRYSRCASVAAWERRIVPRLQADQREGFDRVRGRVATWYVFAKVFVGRDREAYEEAAAHRDRLEGAFGRLWRFGLLGGMVTWKPIALAVRVRSRLRYRHRERSLAARTG